MRGNSQFAAVLQGCSQHVTGSRVQNFKKRIRLVCADHIEVGIIIILSECFGGCHMQSTQEMGSAYSQLAIHGNPLQSNVGAQGEGYYFVRLVLKRESVFDLRWGPTSVLSQRIWSLCRTGPPDSTWALMLGLDWTAGTMRPSSAPIWMTSGAQRNRTYVLR